MANTNMSVSMRDVMARITMNITVTGVREYALRWWVAKLLLRMAAWVGGIGIHIEREH
jgi:hypothetical protein